MDVRVDIAQEPMGDAINIYVHGTDRGRKFVVMPVNLTLQTVDEGFMAEPWLTITRHDGAAAAFLKALAKALVEAGYIPGDPSAAAALRATERHLLDLQKLLKLAPTGAQPR